MYVFFGAGKSRSANKIRLFCFEDGLYVAKGRRNGGLNNVAEHAAVRQDVAKGRRNGGLNNRAMKRALYSALRRVAEMAV